jgi:hypothetical protein
MWGGNMLYYKSDFGMFILTMYIYTKGAEIVQCYSAGLRAG